MEDIGGIIGIIIYLAVLAFFIYALWRIFEKAGKPGWLSIIPIVNFFVLLDIAGKPWWWFILLLIPLVNFVVIFLIYKSLAENFGQGVGFALGLMFLGFIFLPLLAFGDYHYTKAKY